MFSRSADNPLYSQHKKSSIREPPSLDLNVKITDDTVKRSLQNKDMQHYIGDDVDTLSFDFGDKFDTQKEGNSSTQRKSNHGSLGRMRKLIAQAKGFPFGRKSKRAESIKEQNGERNGNAQDRENDANNGNNNEKKEQEKEGENSNDDKGESNGDGKDNGGDDKKGDKDKDDDEKDKDKLKKEKEEEEKEEEKDNEEESDLDEAEVEIKELPGEPIEDPEYNILEDPEFKDLETKSEFGGDDEAAGKVLLDQERKEFYDVLDKTIKIVRGDKKIERKIAKRELIPKCSQGGWRWRSAKFISESTPKEGEGVIWKLQFIDKYDEKLDDVVPLVEPVVEGVPGNEASKEKQEEFIEVNVIIDPSSIAEYKSMTTKDKHHELVVGEKVDILDIFRSRRSTKMLQKWRPATVIAENKYWIRVHFLGWGHVYDEWIHVVQQAKRISKFNQMTHRLERRINRRNNNFQKVLNRKLGYKMVLMDADGNCLFRTVAHQVYGNPKMHRKVREECCKYMLQNRDRFAMVVGDVTIHVRKMRKDREWGDDTEIRAMEELYDRRFEIFNVSGMGTNYRPMKIHFDGDLPKKIHKLTPIRLSYHGHCHYNSIIPMSWKLSKKDNTIQPLKRRKTCYIKDHREKMMRKADREEKKRKQNAAHEEKLKAEKEKKDRELKEMEDQKAEEKVEEDDGEDNQGPEDEEIEKEREDGVVVVDVDEEVEIISDKRVLTELQDGHHSGQTIQTITTIKTSSNGKTKSTEKKTSVLSQRSIKSDAQKHVITTDKEDKSVERSSEDSGPPPQKMKVSVSEAEANNIL